MELINVFNTFHTYTHTHLCVPAGVLSVQLGDELLGGGDGLLGLGHLHLQLSCLGRAILEPGEGERDKSSDWTLTT